MTELPGKEAPGTEITGKTRVPVGADKGTQKQAGDGEHSDVEVLAMKMGWNPEHDENSGRTFKTAEQYIIDSKEIQDTTVKTLNTLKKTNEELVAGMKNLRQHHTKLAEVEKGRIDDQITELNKKRDKHIEDADKTAVKVVDDKIENLKNAKKDMETPAADPAAAAWDAVAKDWQTENQWYGVNTDMTAYIDAQSERFKGLKPEVYFEKLSEAAMTMFPDAFKNTAAPGTKTNQNQNQQQTVVGGQVRQTGGGFNTKPTFNDLSPSQQKWAVFYENKGVMTRDEYVDEQAKIGNIQPA